ncbi:MAG: M6 family metalloprotease domain-containing protein [Dysgonamonadaceae bacterium]|nr:M6 family metalloprotease domain-containing protein [Dysgonamonadaceae bacterium]
MKRHFLIYIIFASIVLFSRSAFSVPAYPYLITLTQPGEEEIIVKMKGDERIKWMESEDGYSLLYDKDKNIVYAILNEKGDMIPSDIKASNITNRSPEVIAGLRQIPKGLRYSNGQKQMLRQIEKIENKTISYSTRAIVGTARAICALIEFPDKPFTHTLEEFELLMNQSGYNTNGARGSVRDFYLENSYGQLILEVTVTGIYTAAKNRAYYGENGNGNLDKHPDELAREAANFAFNDPSINPSDFDNDGDGYLDTFHFIFAGYGEESGGEADCIWSHKSNLYPSLTFGNKQLNTYSCSSELRGNNGANITHIGAICHELCHIFGAPDFYDSDGESNGEFIGTGEWDLMAMGAWNGDNANPGACPAHINMYQKIVFGWVNPDVLDVRQKIVDMPNSSENPVSYIINTPTPNEYFVLENRQKRNFDLYLPGHGLLIYHVSIAQQDISRNTVNNKHPQKVYPVYAASTYEIPSGEPNSYGLINSDLCTFPGASLNRTFNKTTTPAMLTWGGESVSKPITEITEENGLISFQFMASLLNLTASVSGKQLTLNWITPTVEEEIKGYNIYRNAEFINFTNGNAFRETLAQEGTYIYGLSIQYKDAESEREEIEVVVTFSATHTVIKSVAIIYPNPVKKGNRLTINLGDNGGKADLSFYDFSGRLITQQQISASNNYFIIDLPTGMYFIKIVKEQSTEVFKLTVE